MLNKILMLSNMYPTKEYPIYGVFVEKFEKNMIQMGVNVYKVVIKGRSKNFFEKLLKYIKYEINVIDSVFNKEFDLIYIHFMGHSLLALLPVFIFLDKPIVINAHGGDVLNHKFIGKLIQKLTKPIIRSADLIVSPSEYFKRIIVNKFNFNKNKIYVSPSGGVELQDLYIDYNKKNYKFTIGYVSRIRKGKGWDVLLRAILELKKKCNYEFQVIIIGGGPRLKELLSMIKKMKLEEFVIYKGSVSQKNLASYFLKFDIFIFPTCLPESLGLVGLEAMSCGVPVIGTDIGGLKDYIIDDYNGKLFNKNDYHELSNKILEYMNYNISEKNDYKMNAIETANRYNSKRVSINLYEKLNEVVKNNI